MPAHTLLLLGLLVGVGARPLPTAAGPPPTAQQPGSGAGARKGPTDPAEIGAFLDGLMQAFMADHHVAGATISVVRDGGVLFSKGYGYADVAGRQPVDPATTLFRVGSISKLFTWTAVMQLVEEGKLDLDRDVNDYLDFRIPATYREPMTLRHFMTHTPGFEDRVFGLFSETELSRGELLERNMPARVRPPGTYAAYSNYATALAGYIVERASGTAWEDYVEQHVLRPLGMMYATGRQPLPDDLAPHMSEGYTFPRGRYEEKPFETIDPFAPAGAVSASADAMAKFMIAHLQYGHLDDARILREETARDMQTRQFGHDPRLNGLALGFYEQSSHGLRLVGHGGDTQWFHSDLSLIPSEGVGIFISTNTAAGGEISFAPFLEAFLDHYYPVPPPTLESPPEHWRERAKKYAGSYMFNRRSYTTFERALSLFSAMPVAVADSGALVVRGWAGPVRVYEVEPGLFRDREGSMDVSFEEDDAGKVSRLFVGQMPMAAADKLTLLQRPAVHRIILLATLLVILSPLVLMPVRYLAQRSVEGIEPLTGRERGLRWLALTVTLFVAGFVVGMVALGAGGATSVVEGRPGPLEALLVLPMVAALGTVAVVIAAVVAWQARLWGRWGRVHYALFALAAVVFVLELNYWNLLGWKI